eukprot:TRINITY_DN2036_c1_g1_i2.p1 TRINITY_DN2036_c1_g1~~TRINITY_DN2036_c1_g1_i2.p1  ORF type:complete len:532 (-),score=95.77 TRINITY_DN2036_c1_g1_i2:251-1846(-)
MTAVKKDIAFEPEKVPQVALSKVEGLNYEGDLLAMAVYEDELTVKDKEVSVTGDKLKAVNDALGGVIQEIIADGDFKGKPGNSQFLRVGGKFRYFGLIGLGSREKAMGKDVAKTFMGVGETIANAAKTNKCAKCGFSVLGGIDESASADIAASITRGVILGAFESTRFKTEPKESKLESVELLSIVADSKEQETKKAIYQAEVMSRGAFLTRYLVEAPSNYCTPAYMAETAKYIADAYPEVMKLEVLEKADCEALGMGCFLGVAQGSEEPPKFIHLTYTPKSSEVKTKLAFVGKGVTFDTGGYDIKLRLMPEMKFDMGGSGAVMGAARILGELQPEGVEIHFIVAATENMISGKAYKASDILVASNGKTVEVGNTDAEGRLTLADALIFAQEKCGVNKIVDMATLTGAVIVGIGPKYAGFYTDNEDMYEEFLKVSNQCGDSIWRMPLEPAYDEYNKSKIADLCNKPSSDWGGSINAALFLKNFVDCEKVQWAHIDMAGPVWNWEKKFATGYGAQLFAMWALTQGSSQTPAQ